MRLQALSILVAIQLHGIWCATKPRVICYWANNLPGGSQPEDIDVTLCTHIHYAFHVMDAENTTIVDGRGSPQPDTYNRLLALKQRNPDLQVVVSVGGWGHPDIKFSRVVNSADLRRKFIANVIPYIQKYKFDGLDLDWEYPVCWTGNCTAGPKSDRPNFGIFVKEIREAFNRLTPRLTISAAVVAGYEIADIAMDYKAIGEALDYVNIMTYDLAPVTALKTAHHSKYNVCIADVEDYVKKGVPKEKATLGVPFHARTFELKDPAQHGIGAPIIKNGKLDYDAYRHVCTLVKNENWPKVRSDQNRDPYTYKDTEWIGFDDPYAANEKSKWVRDNGYGGIIIWEVGLDDQKHSCCTVANPMLRAINNGLYGTGSGPETYGCEPK